MKRKPSSRLSRVRARHFVWFLAASVVVLSTVGIIYIWLLGDKTEKTMVDQVESQQQTLARSGALAIEDFLASARTELFLLRQIEAVEKMEEEKGIEAFRVVMAHFPQEDTPLLVDIGRIDGEGKMVWSVDAQGGARKIEAYMSDRDYFLWAKQQGKPGEIFISAPLVARGGMGEGKTGIAMATPVFSQGNFAGVVFMGFLLDSLTQKYVLPLSFSPQTEVTLINQGGTIISSTLTEVVNQDFRECAGLSGETGEGLFQEVVSGKEGSLIHDCHLPGENKQKMKIISAYAPVRVNGEGWVLLVSLPYEKATELAWPFKSDQMKGLIFALVSVLVLCLIFILGMRVAQRNAFVNGFHNGYRNGHKIKSKVKNQKLKIKS